MIGRDQVGALTGQIRVAGQHDKLTLEMALSNYGHLIARGESITMDEFGDRVSAAYDCEDNPQNAAVLGAIRRSARLTS